MRTFCLLLILLITLVSQSFGLRYVLENRGKFFYAYDILPSADFNSSSSALLLGYYIDERSAIEIDYTSFDSATLSGSSYSLTYRLTLGLEDWWITRPSAIIGYRFIFTPETGFFAPLDLGISAEIPLSEGLSLRLPIIFSLSDQGQLLDATLTLERKDAFLGNLVLGVRNIKALANSSFIERSLVILGFKNWL